MTEPLTVRIVVAEPSSADEAVLDVLPPAEAARADRFRRPADRARFLTAQALLRRTIGEELGLDPAEVALDRRCPGCGAVSHGPLALRGEHADRVSLSSSHSGSRVVVGLVVVEHGVAPSVGVDVEEVGARESTLDVAPTVLTPDELDAHRRAPHPHADLITRWCRKEAVLKATRQGLTVPMSDVAVTGPDEQAAVRTWTGNLRPPGVEPASIAMADIEVGESYRAAVAVLTDRPLRLDRRH